MSFNSHDSIFNNNDIFLIILIINNINYR